MTIHEITQDSLVPIKGVTFASKKILEREHLQSVIRSNIAAIAPDCFVLAEEFSDWEGSGRSIDLLCLDKEASLVVVELKRTEDGGHMDLQAIRYAAMISQMTFAEAVYAHTKFLTKLGQDPSNAETAILNFLEWEEPNQTFGGDVRIVLVSADFSKEITTSVIWLNERDLDISCVRIAPYEFMGKILVDIQQVLPFPEAAEYQVRVKRKAAEKRQTGKGADWTKYDLKIGSKEFHQLYKRHLFLRVVKGLIEQGRSVADLEQILPARKFLGLSGKMDGDEFRKKALEAKTPSGALYDLRRFFIGDADLFFSDGKTWALSNQWSIHLMPKLEKLIAEYPQGQISYQASAEEA